MIRLKTLFGSLSILISLFVNTASYSTCTDKPIIIAVVDTGFGFKGAGNDAHLCKIGHRDFSTDQVYYNHPASSDPIPLDVNGHGTNIVGLIQMYANLTHVNYCIVVIKYYGGADNHLLATTRGFEYASSIGADYINYSGGGRDPYEPERIVVERFLDGGGHMTVAAGNNSCNLDMPQNSFYPAKYDRRLVVVGSLDPLGKQLPSSNFGTLVNRWELGYQLTVYGITMTGTSQATAIATGKQVSKSTNKCEVKY